MSHPEDLLADYIDGTLPPDERAVVDAHLADCAVCREEIGLAGRAAAALAALPEEPVPLGLRPPILAEARREAAPRPHGWERYQWAAGLAAAACLLLVAVVLGPQLIGGSTDEEGAARAPSAEMEAGDDATLGAGTTGTLQVEVLERDLDDRDLRRIARETAKVAPATPVAEDAVAFLAPDEAISCLAASGATMDERDVLVRVIEADYLGTPAYLGVFHEGPGGGEPPNKVVVWVVSRADCAILTIASQAI
jgi:hypothetical protein